MRILQLRECHLSDRAAQLVQFDMDSIRQIVAAGHGESPEVWLADPDQYEHGGRVLRDSPTPRLLAYAADSRMLYVTDGCNSCAHQLPVDLPALGPAQLLSFAERNSIGLKLLERLAQECRRNSGSGTQF
jgi:hypothetical protein